MLLDKEDQLALLFIAQVKRAKKDVKTVAKYVPIGDDDHQAIANWSELIKSWVNNWPYLINTEKVTAGKVLAFLSKVEKARGLLADCDIESIHANIEAILELGYRYGYYLRCCELMPESIDNKVSTFKQSLKYLTSLDPKDTVRLLNYPYGKLASDAYKEVLFIKEVRSVQKDLDESSVTILLNEFLDTGVSINLVHITWPLHKLVWAHKALQGISLHLLNDIAFAEQAISILDSLVNPCKIHKYIVQDNLSNTATGSGSDLP